MPKPRRKPCHPRDIIAQIARNIPERKSTVEVMMPVAFIETPAQNAGCTVEIIREPGKARRKKRYRKHILERMEDKRLVSRRQVLAGLKIHDAWCSTQLSPPAIQEIYVDAPCRPDDVAVAQVEAMQAYADLMGLVPAWYRAEVRRTACERYLPQTAAQLDLLRRGLSALADKLRY